MPKHHSPRTIAPPLSRYSHKVGLAKPECLVEIEAIAAAD
jgi:hypothetical protein